jgi:hypothetical protein
LREHLEPHIPAIEFSLHHYDPDRRLLKDPTFSPFTLFRIDYSPAKWRDSHWTLGVYPALSKDKPLIRDAMIATGFSYLADFLGQKRSPIWQGLSFSRSLMWNASAKLLLSQDRNQLEKEPNQSPHPTLAKGQR